MFTNLIESSSHAKEFKRRGSFLLFTFATYIVLFVITGVVSIYAYDARLDEQTLEIVVMLPPQELAPQPDPQSAVRPDRPRNNDNNNSNVTERAVAMLSVNVPQHPPDEISTTPNKNLSLPDRGLYAITGRDREAGSPGGPGSPFGGGRQVVQPAQVVSIDEPPPLPDPPKPSRVISKGPITGEAISLPKPNYPALAKQMRIQGTVNVQVLIDEMGRVISAKALGGSPFLTVEAQKAAMQARFSPTKLGDQPVKVSGVITYNFVLSN
jgi:protein TonB